VSRILIVEDTPANIQSLVAVLRQQDYQVSVATNGKQALEVLACLRPDLILLDIMMPEMDGFESCARIKQSPQWQDIPIIFLTARTETCAPSRPSGSRQRIPSNSDFFQGTAVVSHSRQIIEESP
jgi:CheY-like chemotaxis protein